jgi:hypothetical protein
VREGGTVGPSGGSARVGVGGGSMQVGESGVNAGG